MRLIVEFTQLSMQLILQLELTRPTLKLTKIRIVGFFLKCLEPGGFEPFPEKQTNTVTFFSPEKFSTAEVLFICTMRLV